MSATRCLDHALRMLQHYGSVNGNAQAGAVTYFGFLSIFPILAIAFFFVGKIAQLYPDIQGDMIDRDREVPAARRRRHTAMARSD